MATKNPLDTACLKALMQWRSASMSDGAKPHRAPFDRALALLEVAPPDAVFVGDDLDGTSAGAQNAGLRPVLLGSAASPLALETIQNLEDVIRLVDE